MMKNPATHTSICGMDYKNAKFVKLKSPTLSETVGIQHKDKKALVSTGSSFNLLVILRSTSENLLRATFNAFRQLEFRFMYSASKLAIGSLYH
jgi:hypothetical protein